MAAKYLLTSRYIGEKADLIQNLPEFGLTPMFPSWPGSVASVASVFAGQRAIKAMYASFYSLDVTM